MIASLHAAAGGSVERMSFELLRRVAAFEKAEDKCHYNLSSKVDGPFVLMLDYQRYFATLISATDALSQLDEVLDAAMSHFNMVGEQGIVAR